METKAELRQRISELESKNLSMSRRLNDLAGMLHERNCHEREMKEIEEKLYHEFEHSVLGKMIQRMISNEIHKISLKPSEYTNWNGEVSMKLDYNDETISRYNSVIHMDSDPEDE